jgi:predicted FMN-binding regulatory protein PaiB
MPPRQITEELLRRLRETLERLQSLQSDDPSDPDLSALKSVIESRIKRSRIETETKLRKARSSANFRFAPVAAL